MADAKTSQTVSAHALTSLERAYLGTKEVTAKVHDEWLSHSKLPETIPLISSEHVIHSRHQQIAVSVRLSHISEPSNS
jgi:hypothetical protein